MSKHTVAQVGLGERGRIHIDGFLANSDRFDLVAICDIDKDRLAKGKKDFPGPSFYTDADQMLKETQPDVFCFVTPPAIRLPLVELAAKHHVKGLAFEKPMATHLGEAYRIRQLCRGIKTIVSHQQKYLTSFQKAKQILETDLIGSVARIHVSCLPWLSQLGTHYTDYLLWLNGGVRALWSVGHVHGRTQLTDSHPSPDYLFGQILLENGVRAEIECGYLAPSHMDEDHFWVNNRLTVYGTHGYVWADTDGRWGSYNRQCKGEPTGGEGETWDQQSITHLQADYLRDFADWLDDDSAEHPCNLEIAYHGFEILEGVCLSALDHTRVDFPIENVTENESALSRMVSMLPEVAH